MARLNFNAVFRENNDGSIEPLRRVRVGGVEFGPGVRFRQGVSFSGIDLTQYKGRELEVDLDGDTSVIRGIYENS